jgi:CheY-like chemotaxis protein
MKSIYRGAVLLAEDNPVIAIDIEDVLTRMGADKVHVVATISDALEIIRSEPVRYAVLDILLDNENSFTVAEELSQKRIPYIFASGFDRACTLQGRFPEAGYIAKPYSETRLLEALAQKLADE